MNVCEHEGFCEIRTKFARNSYEFLVNLSEFFQKKTFASSFCPRWPSQRKHKMKLRGYHTPGPVFIILAGTLSSVTGRRAQNTPTKKQTALKKNFAKWGGGRGTPHVGQTAHAWRVRGGGAVYLYSYVPFVNGR